MGNSAERRKERRLAERVAAILEPFHSKKPIDAWLQLLGIAVGIGFWLWPDKTPAGVVIALVLMFVCLFHPVWNFWWIEKKRSRQVAGLGILCAVLVGFGFFAWPTRVVPPSLYAKCETVTSPVLSSSEIYELQLRPIPISMGGGGLATVSNTKGDHIVLPTGNLAMLESTYRCEITAYGSEPLTDITLALREEFREAIDEPQIKPNAKRQGKTTLVRDWPIMIDKLDPGQENAFTFYIMNYLSTFFVHVRLPDSASYRILGDGFQSSKPVAHPDHELFFGPYWPN